MLSNDSESGPRVILKNRRFGAYVQLGEAQNKKERPKTASLFKSMTPETVTLSQALLLLTLPREVGVAPDGEVVTAANCEFGPYLTKGKESRSLESGPQLLSISLEDALVVLAQPKTGRQQRGVEAPPEGAWERPGEWGEGRAQAGAVWSVCDRRGDECLAADGG